MAKRPPLVIVDATYLIHRGYHATNNLTTSNGLPVGAVFNFLKTIRMVANKFETNDFIFCFDGKDAGAARKTLSPAYKGHRKEQRQNDPNKLREYEEVQVQMKLAQEATAHFTRPTVTVPGWEADDGIYLGVKWSREVDPTRPVLVVSNDKDMYQLVSKRCSIYRPIEEKILDNDNFEETTGVNSPKKWVLYRVCTGDSSDNIQGVKGIGDTWGKRLVNASPATTLVEWLEWASALRQNPDELAALGKGAAGMVDKLLADPKAVKLAYKLMRIGAVHPRSSLTKFERELEKQADKEFNLQLFIKWLSKLEFNSIMQDTLFWRSWNRAPLGWAGG